MRFIKPGSCMNHYTLFGKKWHHWVGPRLNLPAKWTPLHPEEYNWKTGIYYSKDDTAQLFILRPSWFCGSHFEIWHRSRSEILFVTLCFVYHLVVSLFSPQWLDTAADPPTFDWNTSFDSSSCGLAALAEWTYSSRQLDPHFFTASPSKSSVTKNWITC